MNSKFNLTVPEYFSDYELQEFIKNINKIYFRIIDIYDINNYKKLTKKIQNLSESILDEINIIIYCKDKNNYLLETILIIYNQAYKMFLNKKNLFTSIRK